MWGLLGPFELLGRLLKLLVSRWQLRRQSELSNVACSWHLRLCTAWWCLLSRVSSLREFVVFRHTDAQCHSVSATDSSSTGHFTVAAQLSHVDWGSDGVEGADTTWYHAAAAGCIVFGKYPATTGICSAFLCKCTLSSLKCKQHPLWMSITFHWHHKFHTWQKIDRITELFVSF